MSTIRKIFEIAALLVISLFVVAVLFGLSWAFLRDTFPDFYNPILDFLQGYMGMVPLISALVVALTLLLLISKGNKST